MALPSNVSYGHVTGKFLRAVADSSDTDLYPDGQPLAGLTIKFAASVTRVKNVTTTPPVTIIIDPIVCSTNASGVLIDGQGREGVWLVASSDEDLSPTGWTWTATFSASSIASFTTTFTLAPGEEVDLATLIPVPSSPGKELTAWEAVVAEAKAAQAAAQAARTGAESARDEAVTARGAATSAATTATTQASAAAVSATKAAEARDAAVAAAQSVMPSWDKDAGEYDAGSIHAFLAARRDGLAYGVSIPKGAATACTKLGANAVLAVPTPGVIGTPAVDPYTLRGPFFYLEVNATVDNNGFPHVTGIRGDGRFARDGSNGDVWILTPVLYWRWDETGADAVELWVSDTQLEGMGPQPKATLPNGNLRPFMLFAKYALSVDSSGAPRSVSGARFKNRTISHDSLITLCKNATTGYSGKSYADDWYMKAMFLLKYATKNSQSVFAGVTSFTTQTPITVAESGTSRVIVATSAADSIPVGSALMMGTATSNPDRNSSDAYSVFDGARVVSKESYDASNTAITVAADGAFSTSVGLIVSTAPWGAGGCDDVVGDGSPSSPTSGREPFVLQGIEMGLGASEVLGDVILSSDGSTGWQIMLNPDSRNEATSVTAAYTASGGFLPKVASDSIVFPLYPSNGGGLLFGQGSGASSSTGVCDISFIHGTSVSGARQWLSLGDLGGGGVAGLWFVYGRHSLSVAYWGIGSRLSAIGRSQ